MTARRGTAHLVLGGVGLGAAVVALEWIDARAGLGGATTLVSLLPIGLAVVRWGPLAGLATIAIATLGTGVLLGASAGLVVALRQGLPGVALGVALTRRLSLPATLIGVAAVSLVGLSLLLWTLVPSEGGILPVLQRELDDRVLDLERMPDRLGAGREASWAAESARLAAKVMRMAAPAVIVIGLFVVTVSNYLGARLLLRGQGFRPFAEEAVPDHLVWGVIVGGGLLVLGHDTLALTGLNLLLVMIPLYAVQGLAVMQHFFQKVRLPRPLQGVGFGLFALQPVLLVAVACLGLTDLWADFRRIRRAPTPA